MLISRGIGVCWGMVLKINKERIMEFLTSGVYISSAKVFFGSKKISALLQLRP